MDIKKIVFKNLDGSLRKVNIVNSINGIDIPESGAVILDTVKDITTDGSSLTVTKSDGSTSKVTLNASGGVKTVNNVQPDSNGNIEIPVGSVKSVNSVEPDESGNVTIEAGKVKTVNNIQPDESGNVTIEAGKVKTVNGIQPDDSGNIALDYVKNVFVASGMMAVTTQSGTQQYDLRTEYSSSEQSTDDSQVITVNTKTKYHSITLNTPNSSIAFVNPSANPTQLADNSESSGSDAPSTPTVPDMTSSTVIKLELFIKQGTGTNTVTWPANVKWENGIEPVLSLEKDHVDLISLISLDNGQNYYGFAKAVWMN